MPSGASLDACVNAPGPVGGSERRRPRVRAGPSLRDRGKQLLAEKAARQEEWSAAHPTWHPWPKNASPRSEGSLIKPWSRAPVAHGEDCRVGYVPNSGVRARLSGQRFLSESDDAQIMLFYTGVTCRADGILRAAR
jgi:hypothetical protein